MRCYWNRAAAIARKPLAVLARSAFVFGPRLRPLIRIGAAKEVHVATLACPLASGRCGRLRECRPRIPVSRP
jgi:hypothetical protein